MPPPRRIAVALRRLGDEAGHRGRGAGDVAPGHVDRRVTADLPSDRRIEHHDGNAAGQGLERSQAESFVLREEDEHGRPAIGVGQFGVRNVGADRHAVRQPPTPEPRPRDPVAGRSGSRR